MPDHRQEIAAALQDFEKYPLSCIWSYPSARTATVSGHKPFAVPPSGTN
jgi:hypothetical protein